MQKYFKYILLITFFIFLFGMISGCSNDAQAEKAETTSEKQTKVLNNIELSVQEGNIGDTVNFIADELDANEKYQIKWSKFDGYYELDGIYTFIGPKYKEEDIVLVEGVSNDDGIWEGAFKIPNGFGGDHNVYVTQEDNEISQTSYFVMPEFNIDPESGPIGTEIEVTTKGLGYNPYLSMWLLTYDNQYTGAVTGISTNGEAVAKFRATGHVGDHYISLRYGYLGSPYINHEDSPFSKWPAPDFKFTVTDDEPIIENYVEDPPDATDGGIKIPELENNENIKISLDKEEGIVGEENNLIASGLPENEDFDIIWNTMVGSRVSGDGFEEDSKTLDTVTSDGKGNLTFDFDIPDDLGGIPHRIDLKAKDEVYAQEYLRILPSIVDFEPKSGPVGTPIEITIKGGGWTEFDNAYYMTYDNAHMGYMCSFNSQGTLKFTTFATGEPGYHFIDLYPGVYMQEEKDQIDMTLIPQLTYSVDHPGSGMPAIRMSFEVTE